MSTAAINTTTTGNNLFILFGIREIPSDWENLADMIENEPQIFATMEVVTTVRNVMLSSRETSEKSPSVKSPSPSVKSPSPSVKSPSRKSQSVKSPSRKSQSVKSPSRKSPTKKFQSRKSPPVTPMKPTMTLGEYHAECERKRQDVPTVTKKGNMIVEHHSLSRHNQEDQAVSTVTKKGNMIVEHRGYDNIILTTKDFLPKSPAEIETRQKNPTKSKKSTDWQTVGKKLGSSKSDAKKSGPVLIRGPNSPRDSSKNQPPKTQPPKDQTQKDQPQKGFINTTLILKNLPYSCTSSKELLKFFGKCGPIKFINILKDVEGNCKGIAFVRFETKEGADKGLDTDGFWYEDRKIYVEYARDRRD